jgi:hypothetical protein
MYFMHWTRSLRRFAEQQHLASRYVLLTSRKISGPDLLVAQGLADVATIGILHQRVLVHGGYCRFRPRRSQFPRTGLDHDRGPRRACFAKGAISHFHYGAPGCSDIVE